MAGTLLSAGDLVGETSTLGAQPKALSLGVTHEEVGVSWEEKATDGPKLGSRCLN